MSQPLLTVRLRSPVVPVVALHAFGRPGARRRRRYRRPGVAVVAVHSSAGPYLGGGAGHRGLHTGGPSGRQPGAIFQLQGRERGTTGRRRGTDGAPIYQGSFEEYHIPAT